MVRIFMSSFEKKEQNLNQLIDKLNSLSLSYSQPTYELEKIRTEKNELANQKAEIEKKNEELMSCLLYTSPSPRDKRQSRMPSSA